MAIINATGTQDKEVYQEALLSALSDFYNKEASYTNLRALYMILAATLVDTDIESESVRHDNYISEAREDEIVIRTEEDIDRLEYEGAFEVDRIGFVPTNFTRSEVHILTSDITEITLAYIPVNYEDVLIFDSLDETRRQVTQVTGYDSVTNTITIDPVVNRATYVLNYAETGEIGSFTEPFQVDRSLFELGFGEGGFGEFGFGQ